MQPAILEQKSNTKRASCWLQLYRWCNWSTTDTNDAERQDQETVHRHSWRFTSDDCKGTETRPEDELQEAKQNTGKSDSNWEYKLDDKISVLTKETQWRPIELIFVDEFVFNPKSSKWYIWSP